MPFRGAGSGLSRTGLRLRHEAARAGRWLHRQAAAVRRPTRGTPLTMTELFSLELGYPLNLSSPRSFNEKVQWKKCHDRNPLLPITADKYRAREHVAQLLGPARAADVLIPLVHVTADPATIPFDDLPGPCIVKPNHASGASVIVDRGPARQEVVAACRRWLETPYGIPQLEWAYEPIERKIIVEQLLQDDRGQVPDDYKFFMFHGECACVCVCAGRFGDNTRGFYSPSWERLPVTYRYPPCGDLAAPPRFEEMLDLAGCLSAGFDFVRVDLYSTARGVSFGEFTHYPASGLGRFVPRKFDFQLGERWQIEDGYWRKPGQPA